MPFVKVLKNKAYFKRYQVKFRRRREGKTDYAQRRKLITQDKNKYKSPKYRLVVRFSNRYVLCQIVYAEINGDKVITQAHSKELENYGLSVGLKNYAAAYATGLLVARRLLNKLGMEELYEGNTDVTGEATSIKVGRKKYYVAEMDDDRRPFRALLDVGTTNTTTGARVFAAMKGASDGGLDIPHNERRFPGYDRDTKEFDAEVHRDHIFGEHVADYMREMEEDDEENYKKHFAKYIEADVDADGLEELYESVHEAIREKPQYEKAPKFDFDKKYKKKGKDSYEERKARVEAKKAEIRANL